VIAYVEGVLVQGGRDAVIAVAGGQVGLDVLLSERGAGRLPPVGDLVKLWTHLAVREDAWTLYGFPTREERAMFRLLLTVTGIGPRVALGMLSGAEPAEIARCLRLGDEKSLARLPGIGKKSAARLVVELGQRVPAALGEAPASGESAFGEVPPAGPLGEALQVLCAMGLLPVQAETLLLQARRVHPELADDVQAWIRAALAGLGAPGR